MENLHIVVDSREHHPFDFAGEGYGMVTVSTGTLQTGDYSVKGLEDTCAVERKSLDDLANCLGRDRERFLRQLQRGRGLDAFAVIVEASWIDLAQGNYAARGLHPHSACQSVASFMARLGVPFMFAGTRTAAEYCTWSFLYQYAQGIRRRLRAVEQAMDALQPPRAVPRAKVLRMARAVEM